MPSAWYAYAVLHRTATLPRDLTELSGESLTMVPWQDLAAVVGVAREPWIRPEADAVLRHARVVEALWDAGPTLPVRFGTVLSDTAAVAHALADRYEVLRADLERVGDKMELGLTVLWDSGAMVGHGGSKSDGSYPEEQPGAQGRGARYLLSRGEAYRQERAMRTMAKAVAEELEQRLVPLVRETRYVVDTAPRLAIRASYLVDRGALDEAQSVLAGCRSLYPTLRFLVSGPWPPYSFVSPPPADATLAGVSPRETDPLASARASRVLRL